MARNCAIIPQVRNNKGQIVDSKLFKSLLAYTGNNRSEATRLYLITKNSEFIKTAINARRENAIGLFEFIKEIKAKASELDFPEEMIHRSINVGASGGERKKNEVLQLEMLEPKFIILDELDSGLDVDSLRKVSDGINKYLKEHPKTSVLIITHYPRMLEYIKPQFVHMMVCGKIVKTGGYDLAFEKEKKGYSDTSVIGSDSKDE